MPRTDHLLSLQESEEELDQPGTEDGELRACRKEYFNVLISYGRSREQKPNRNLSGSQSD